MKRESDVEIEVFRESSGSETGASVKFDGKVFSSINFGNSVQDTFAKSFGRRERLSQDDLKDSGASEGCSGSVIVKAVP